MNITARTVTSSLNFTANTSHTSTKRELTLALEVKPAKFLRFKHGSPPTKYPSIRSSPFSLNSSLKFTRKTVDNLEISFQPDPYPSPSNSKLLTPVEELEVYAFKQEPEHIMQEPDMSLDLEEIDNEAMEDFVKVERIDEDG